MAEAKQTHHASSAVASASPVVHLFDEELYFLHTTLLPLTATPTTTYRAQETHHKVHRVDTAHDAQHSAHDGSEGDRPAGPVHQAPRHTVAAAWLTCSRLLISCSPCVETVSQGHTARQMCGRPEDRGAMYLIHLPALDVAKDEQESKDTRQATTAALTSTADEITALTSLPFASFDGIVRDYTPMSLARHAGPLHRLWQEYTRLQDTQREATQPSPSSAAPVAANELGESNAAAAAAAATMQPAVQDDEACDAHRFLVSSAAQHAIYAIEVRVRPPSARTVAPAEFFASPADTGDAARESSTAHAGTHSAALDAERRDADQPISGSNSGGNTPLPRRRIGPLLTPTPERPTTRPRGEEGEEGTKDTTSLSHSPDHDTQSVAASPPVQHEAARATGHGALPLMGGVVGFVDGVFGVARFRGPTALCWRVDAAEATSTKEAEEAQPHTACCHCPCTVLFISDTGNHAIRYASFATGLVRTISGLGGSPGYRDGACAASALAQATSLLWCTSGLFFCDGPNGAVRLITGIGKPREHASDAMRNNKEDEGSTKAALVPSSAIAVTLVTEKDAMERRAEHAASASSEEPRVWTVAGGDMAGSTSTTNDKLVQCTEECYVDADQPQHARVGAVTSVMAYPAACLGTPPPPPHQQPQQQQQASAESAPCVLLLVDTTGRAVRVLDASGLHTLVNTAEFTSGNEQAGEEDDTRSEASHAPVALMAPAAVLACNAPAQLLAARSASLGVRCDDRDAVALLLIGHAQPATTASPSAWADQLCMSALLPCKQPGAAAAAASQTPSEHTPPQPGRSFVHYVRRQLPGLLPPCPPDTTHCTPRLYCHIASRRRAGTSATGPAAAATRASTPSSSASLVPRANEADKHNEQPRQLPPHVPLRAHSSAPVYEPGSRARSAYEMQYGQLPPEARQARLHAVVAQGEWAQYVHEGNKAGQGVRARSAPAPPHRVVQSAASAAQLGTPRTGSHAVPRRPGLMPRSLSAHRLMRPRQQVQHALAGSARQSEGASGRSHSAGTPPASPSPSLTAAVTREQMTQTAYDDAVARLFFVYKQLADRHVEYHTISNAVAPPSQQPQAAVPSSLCATVEERVQYSLSILQLWRVLFHTGYLRTVVQCVLSGQREIAGPGEAPTLLVAAEQKATNKTKQQESNHADAATAGALEGGRGGSRNALRAALRSRRVNHGSNDDAERKAGEESKTLMQLLQHAQCMSTKRRTAATATTAGEEEAHHRNGVPTAALWLPMHPCDFRALVETLYLCGCRTHGYHILVRMDFQHFRRLILLLTSWEAVTAVRRNADSAQKAGEAKAAGQVQEDADAEEKKKGTTQPIASSSSSSSQQQTTMTEAFGRLDLLPSLDALSAEACVKAYQAAYERMLQRVPGIKPYSSSASASSASRVPATRSSSSQQPSHSARGAVVPSARLVTASHPPRNGNGVRATAAQDELVTTPPLSPIARTQATFSPQEAMLHDTPLPDAHDHKAIASNTAPQDVHTEAAVTQSSLAGVDAMLALLAANDKPLHELFQAYSEVVYVRRSAQYSAPLSVAAAAAAASQQSSLIAEVSLSGTPPRVSRDDDTASARQRVRQPSASLQQHQHHHHHHQHERQTRAASQTGRAAPHERCDKTSYAPQDILWKAQQLFTTSAEESARIGQRRHIGLRVMRYSAFLQLFRAVDVFPGLISQALLQRAFVEALHSVLFDDSWLTTTTTNSAHAADAAGKSEERDTAAAAHTMSSAALVAKEKSATAAEAAMLAPALPSMRHTGRASTASSTTPSHAMLQTSAHTHAGLTFLAFVEAFVRVALTVFSADSVVDTVAFPTAAAKLHGLMRWVNQQVRRGYVAERTRTQNTSSAAICGSAAVAPALRSTRETTAHTFPPRLTLFTANANTAPRSGGG